CWMKQEWDTVPEMESRLSYDRLVAEIIRLNPAKKRFSSSGVTAMQVFQRIAAVLILPVLLLAGYFLIRDQSEMARYSEIIVPKGQKSELMLPDSTHIWLNSGSRLRYPVRFLGKRREVYLSGEAYFEVEKDQNRPFVVHAASLAVHVLGTKFNVRAYPDDQDMETALLEGKVKLMLDHSQEQDAGIELSPGDLLLYSGKTGIVKKEGFVPDEVVGWKNNRLIFRDDTFDKLVAKIERWYNVRISYDRRLFQNKRLTVELAEGESLERLFEIIGKAISVEYEIDKQEIKIRPKMKH
ncbi:MAG: FecR family protein, partial [Mangrovibacterium sp.]